VPRNTLEARAAARHLGAMRMFLLLAGLVVLLPAPVLGQPAGTTPRPDVRRGETEALLDALKAAPNEQAAGALVAKLQESWLRAGAPVAVLLLSKGTRNLRNDADEEALEDFEAALVIDPAYLEAYHRRAVARATLGDYRGALADLQEVLSREPRHFLALKTLSSIAEERQDFSGALRAWEKVLEFAPNLPEGQERLKALRVKAQGEEL
jgi:tetratricopeptide (TPR) repeat protein